MKKRILASALITVLVLSTTVFSLAAGSGRDVPVELTTAGEQFSVTLPTSLPISVSSSNEVTTESNLKITNNSNGPVKVTDLKVEGSNSWSIENFTTLDPNKEKVNSKKIALEINGCKTDGKSGSIFSGSGFSVMQGKGSSSNTQDITYNAIVAIQSSAIEDVEVASAIFTLNWDK